jgi:hypothetical protein
MQFPAWVLNNPVTYFGFYGAAGSPSVEVADTLKATSVSPTSVTGSDTIVTLTSPPISRKVTYAFAPGSMAGWGYQTWVDPYDPLGSIVGPEGETHTFQGVEIYQPPYAIGPYAAGVTATAIAFHGPDASGQVVYQSDTGLILEEDVVYSNHSISQNFHSISSAPTPPAASLAWRNADGDTALWNPNGSGGFTFEDLGVVGASWQIAATGNVNGNGESILWRNAKDTVLWKANRSGGFTDEDLGVVGSNWQIAGTGDFNRNAESSILWRNATGDTALWNPNGSGAFIFQDLGVVDNSWQIAGTGDFTGNGQASILWRNANGDTALWNPNGSGGFTFEDLGVVGTSWQIVGTGDYSGDGKSGILWRNSNGDTALWNPNGSGGFAFEDLGVVGTSWSVQKA